MPSLSVGVKPRIFRMYSTSSSQHNIVYFCLVKVCIFLAALNGGVFVMSPTMYCNWVWTVFSLIFWKEKGSMSKRRNSSSSLPNLALRCVSYLPRLVILLTYHSSNVRVFFSSSIELRSLRPVLSMFMIVRILLFACWVSAINIVWALSSWSASNVLKVLLLLFSSQDSHSVWFDW